MSDSHEESSNITGSEMESVAPESVQAHSDANTSFNVSVLSSKAAEDKLESTEEKESVGNASKQSKVVNHYSIEMLQRIRKTTFQNFTKGISVRALGQVRRENLTSRTSFMSGLLLKDYFWSANAPSVSDELVKFGDVVLLNNERQVAETTGLDDDLELYMVLFVTLLEAKRPAAANRNFAYVAMFPVKALENYTGEEENLAENELVPDAKPKQPPVVLDMSLLAFRELGRDDADDQKIIDNKRSLSENDVNCVNTVEHRAIKGSSNVFNDLIATAALMQKMYEHVQSAEEDDKRAKEQATQLDKERKRLSDESRAVQQKAEEEEKKKLLKADKKRKASELENEKAAKKKAADEKREEEQRQRQMQEEAEHLLFQQATITRLTAELKTAKALATKSATETKSVQKLSDAKDVTIATLRSDLETAIRDLDIQKRSVSAFKPPAHRQEDCENAYRGPSQYAHEMVHMRTHLNTGPLHALPLHENPRGFSSDLHQHQHQHQQHYTSMEYPPPSRPVSYADPSYRQEYGYNPPQQPMSRPPPAQQPYYYGHQYPRNQY